jgi:aryl-alcohol dehydrogenase-like predicted oxidoreductase
MERRRLGQSGIVVSDVCMGTMTFGSQCDEQTSHAICNCAWDAGIDFFDTAEVYPVPPKAESVGVTEEIFGQWMKSKYRDAMIVATKVTGPAHGWFAAPVRNSHCTLDRHQIRLACEGSLRRLQTDYIDLYQIHWPDHGMRMEETLGALTELQREGKVRAIGCSNETCWGLMKSLWIAEKHSTSRFDTVQNNFSLINRRCESELAQVCRREGVSLLPYSPLGGGVLTGKYNHSNPPGGRFTAYLEGTAERQRAMAQRFVNARTIETARRAELVAEKLGIPLCALALAWSRQHDFVASTIVGATSVAQLKQSLTAADLQIDAAALAELDDIEREIPNAMTEDGLRRL